MGYSDVTAKYLGYWKRWYVVWEILLQQLSVIFKQVAEGMRNVVTANVWGI